MSTHCAKCDCEIAEVLCEDCQEELWGERQTEKENSELRVSMKALHLAAVNLVSDLLYDHKHGVEVALPALRKALGSVKQGYLK